MEGNVVRAAYILGGSLVLSVLLSGVGVCIGVRYVARQSDQLSQRAADAVLQAPRNMTVSFTNTPVQLRLQNTVGTDDRLITFQVQVKPTVKD